MNSYIYLSTLSLNNCIRVTVVRKNNKLFLAKSALSSEGEELILREIFILRLLQGINGVPRVHEVFLNSQVTSIMSFYPMGDLEINFARLNYESKIKLCLSLVTLVETIHQQNVIHNDIKPSNIVLDSQLNPIICDWTFGDLLHNQPCLHNKSFVGTPLFLAPESFLGHYSKKSDVYSLAATLFWFLNNCLPFSSSNLKDLYKEKIRLNTSVANSDPITAFLLKCLAPNPEHRPETKILKERFQTYVQKLAA